MGTIMAHTSMKDENENITIQITGDGDVEKILCVASLEGKKSIV